MSIETLPGSVAEVVTDRQRRAGFTQAALADHTNIPRATLQRRLTDGGFTLLELIAIARTLGTTPEQILAEARALRTGSARAAS